MVSEQSADELKDLGNKAFGAQDFDKAIELYSKAIGLNASNHVYFSNRSASYGGKKQWDLAAKDAKECIRLDPSFIKGYYRLATAQIELEEWDGATATIKQGLNLDKNNSQLMKLLQTLKKKKSSKKQKKQAYKPSEQVRVGGGGGGEMDAKELQDLQQQYLMTTREYQTVQANIVHAQKELRANEITKSELGKLDGAPETRIYRGIGKMFVLSSQTEVMDHLTNSIESAQKREKDLGQKMEYLERRLKSQEQNMEELTKTRPSASE